MLPANEINFVLFSSSRLLTCRKTPTLLRRTVLGSVPSKVCLTEPACPRRVWLSSEFLVRTEPLMSSLTSRTLKHAETYSPTVSTEKRREEKSKKELPRYLQDIFIPRSCTREVIVNSTQNKIK
ncbi:hypothetical protein WAI453_006034 [Rhynchosporium graminicola]